LHTAFIYLATASVYFLSPLIAEFEGFFKIETLQEFLGKEGSDLAWKLEGLLHNMFYFGAHAAIITKYSKAYQQIPAAKYSLSAPDLMMGQYR
jgi:hypothetical protein